MASFDIYAAVTDRIISEMEKGIIPWAKPWGGTVDGAISHSTGKPYSLINQLLLGESGEYITFKQCEAEGGRVKKRREEQVRSLLEDHAPREKRRERCAHSRCEWASSR